jgi:hypothetical protein
MILLFDAACLAEKQKIYSTGLEPTIYLHHRWDKKFTDKTVP